MASMTAPMSLSPIESPNAVPRLLEQTLNVEMFGCGVTTCTFPFSTNWRSVPFMVNAHAVGLDSRIEIVDREPLILRDQQAFCIPAGMRHRITLLTPGSAVSSWSHAQFTVLSGVDLLSIAEPLIIISGQAARRLGEINAQLTRIQDDQGINAIVERRILIFQLLALVLPGSMVAAGNLERIRQIQRLAPALVLIESRLQDPELGIEDLAAACQLSISRFRSVFTSLLGVSPRGHLQVRRMRKAEQLLLGGEEKIRQVAFSAGWADEFHFSRIFKRLHGVSPLAYREQARKSGW